MVPPERMEEPWRQLATMRELLQLVELQDERRPVVVGYGVDIDFPIDGCCVRSCGQAVIAEKLLSLFLIDENA